MANKLNKQKMQEAADDIFNKVLNPTQILAEEISKLINGSLKSLAASNATLDSVIKMKFEPLMNDANHKYNGVGKTAEPGVIPKPTTGTVIPSPISQTPSPGPGGGIGPGARK